MSEYYRKGWRGNNGTQSQCLVAASHGSHGHMACMPWLCCNSLVQASMQHICTGNTSTCVQSKVITEVHPDTQRTLTPYSQRTMTPLYHMLTTCP